MESIGELLDACRQSIAIGEWKSVCSAPDEFDHSGAAPSKENDDTCHRGHQQDAQAGRQRVQRVVGVKEQRDHERDPEQDVQYHCRANSLHGDGESGIRRPHLLLGEEAVHQGGAEGRATRHDVAYRQGREVDLHDASAMEDSWRQNRVREHHPGGQSGGFEDDADQGHPDVAL